MDKCPKCGAAPEDTSRFAFDSWACESWHSHASDRFIESLKCCRRQLAAANERAGRLEAQMVELREAWAGKYNGPGTVMMAWASTPYDTIERILEVPDAL